jgi:hypothetical protein
MHPCREKGYRRFLVFRRSLPKDWLRVYLCAVADAKDILGGGG